MVLRDAARATLAAGTARVSQRRFLEPGGELMSSEEGVTDFERRRTRTVVRHEDPYGLSELLETKFPWLVAEDDEEDAGPPTTVYAGAAQFHMSPDGHVVRISDDDPAASWRGHTDPVWIVEVLEHVHREDRTGDGRCRFVVDLAETGSALEIPPHRGRRAPRIAGEAWLDDAGRIARATWSRFDRARSRRPSGRRAWTTTELSDFGTPVTIALPSLDREPPLPLALARAAIELRRRKRAYERR